MSDPRDMPEAHVHVPYDIDVEQAVLGSMLRDNRLIDIAAADMDGTHFYDPLHARLFDMIVHLQTEGDVTPLILHAVMKSDPGVIEVGGQAYFDGLYFAAPAMPRMREYVSILLDLAFRRDLARIGTELQAQAHEPPGSMSARQVADAATEALLQAGRVTAKPILSIHEHAMASVREAEAIKQGRPVPMISTGFHKVDKELGGYRGGDLIIILGKSGMGKSALMGTVSRVTAQFTDLQPRGVPTIVFSLEMVGRQWVERMICDLDFDTAEKPMWYSRVRNGKMTDDEFARFIIASGQTQDWPIEIHDDDDLTMTQISSRARAFAAKHGKNPDGSPRMGLVIIDYLQIVVPSNDRDNRERQVAQIARGAKSLAKRLGWPVLAASQMNDGDNQRAKEERRPQASDARESKAIMNEADIMLAPYRPAFFIENRKPMDCMPGDPAYITWAAELKAVIHRFELLTLKNRHGRRKDFELYCDMGASAIRDEDPQRSQYVTAEEEAAADLLENL